MNQDIKNEKMKVLEKGLEHSYLATFLEIAHACLAATSQELELYITPNYLVTTAHNYQDYGWPSEDLLTFVNPFNERRKLWWK